MNRILIALALLFAALAARAVDLSTTPLGIATAALQPGQAARFDTPGYQTIPMDGDQFYYGDSAVWNPVKQRIEFVAAAVTGEPRHYYVYDVSTDMWQADDVGLWAGPGHGFDSNAVDTVSGVHYFAKYSGPVLQRDDATGTWGELPPAPIVSGTTPALEYLPGSGLVLASRNGDVAVYNGAAWSPRIPGAAAWGNTENWVTTVGDVAYLGVSSLAYRLTKDAAQPIGYLLTAIPNPPVPIGNSQAIHTTDGQHLIVALKNGSMWYEFDGVAWKERPDLVSGAVVNKWHYYVAFIPELKVIMTLSMRNGVRDVWLTKVGASAPPPPPAPQCVPQSVLPPEYWGLPLCTAEAPKRDACDQPGVFVCDRFNGPLNGTIYASWSGATKPYVKDGTLRFEIVANGGTDPGHYRPVTPLIEEGDTLAWSYGRRQDAESVKHQNQKHWILWAGASSCTDQQLVGTNITPANVPINYRSCGLGLAPKLPNGDVLYQHGGSYECSYRAVKAGDLSGCHVAVAGKWADYYLELRVGHYGQADSLLTQYVREEGSDWRKLNVQTVLLPASRPFDHFMLTAYMTSEPQFTHPTGVTEFRNLIMSTQPMDLALL